MKIRESIQVSQGPREDEPISRPPASRTSNKEAMAAAEKERSQSKKQEHRESIPTALPKFTPSDRSDSFPRPSRKRTMQDFFRNAGANLEPSKLALRPAPSQRRRQPNFNPNRQSRIYKPPPSNRNSQLRTLDINDEVLDKLMGSTKNMGGARIRSEDFIAKQKMRARKHKEEKRCLGQEEVERMFVGAPQFRVSETRVEGGGEWGGDVDPGTISFEEYVQIPAEEEAEEPTFERRRLLASAPAKLGLRRATVEALIDRLAELDELKASERSWKKEKVEEMGEDLFRRLLDAGLAITPAGTGSVTLRTQITALQKVLNVKDLWYDFSSVHWQLRVGQLLWASSEEERDIMLLQITLAAELWVRMEAFKVLSGQPRVISEEDRRVLATPPSTKIYWDLTLAETFLENVTVTADITRTSATPAYRASSRYSTATTFFTAKENAAVVQPVFAPKDEEGQLAKLLVFAETLEWPHAKNISDGLAAKVAAHSKKDKDGPASRVAGNGTMKALRPTSGISGKSVYATPLSSPSVACFAPPTGSRGAVDEKSPAKSVLLLAAASSTIAETTTTDALEVGGWLSRSWLSGLVLPGEVESHLLMSTLLENSPQAVQVLGQTANLYGGFVYQGRGYWSTRSVFGKVLAASKDAVAYMGWVAVSQRGQPDGWIRLTVQDQEVRIEPGAKESDPLGASDGPALQADSFTTPLDGPRVMGNEVVFDTLSLNSAARGQPRSSETSIAHLTFRSPINSKLGSLQLRIKYNVDFIASHPCDPRPTLAPKIALPIDASEESSKNDVRADSARTSRAPSTYEKKLPPPPAHPLHISYRFETIPVATVLSADISSVLRDDEVKTVLDCRGSEDLEVLARAWCAHVGLDAVIGKSGRACLACCVREARAVGVRVVVRT